MFKTCWFSICIALFLVSCSSSKRTAQKEKDIQTLLADSALLNAHVGICIYDASQKTYLHTYQADKYFVPASNAKLFTCYAAMKYLGDSLVGLRYQDFSDTAINIYPTGDPTFMHPDFSKQPVLDFLKTENKSIYIGYNTWKSEALGKGWSWDDYNDDYMVERSPMPIYGNVINIKAKDLAHRLSENSTYRYVILPKWSVVPSYFQTFLDTAFVLPSQILAQIKMRDSSTQLTALSKFNIQRSRLNNNLSITFSNEKFSQTTIPFFTGVKGTVVDILQKDFGIKNIRMAHLYGNDLYGSIPAHLLIHTIHSQPTDSLLKIAMHRSDNFFAEQALLMVSNEQLGYMNDAAIIDTLLKTDLKDLPQPPVWVDGSGLSRYNIFTPEDFVKVLEKMKDEFGMERMKVILATGGEGTISSYYKNLSGQIFAKTGTLSGHVALSGYLFTKKKKLLIFSILVNNHNTSATKVRKAVERFVMTLWEKE